MTVNNLNFMRGGTFPTKADAPLVVDTDAVLPSSCYELSQTGHASQGKFGEGNGWTQMDTDSVCHEEAQTAQNFNRETRQPCESSEGGAPRGPNYNHEDHRDRKEKSLLIPFSMCSLRPFQVPFNPFPWE